MLRRLTRPLPPHTAGRRHPTHFYFQEGDDPPWYKPGLAAAEYVGKAKGMKQILWERALWKEGMLVEIDEEMTPRAVTRFGSR